MRFKISEQLDYERLSIGCDQVFDLMEGERVGGAESLTFKVTKRIT